MFQFLCFYIKDASGTEQQLENGSEEVESERESKFLSQKLNATICNSYFFC
jgi:hypothetical protein